MGNKKVLYVILAVICLSLTACVGAGVMYSLMSANRSELNSSSIDGNKLQLKNETSIAKVASDVWCWFIVKARGWYWYCC